MSEAEPNLEDDSDSKELGGESELPLGSASETEAIDDLTSTGPAAYRDTAAKVKGFPVQPGVYLMKDITSQKMVVVLYTPRTLMEIYMNLNL